MSSSAWTCRCSMLSRPSQSLSHRSTASQTPPSYRIPCNTWTSRSSGSAWSSTEPSKRSLARQALPGAGEMVEMAIKADASMPDMPDIGGVIDTLVSSGAPGAVTEIAQEFQTFEPQMNPFVAVAALAAAVPPVLFWSRVFMSARKRMKEDAAKEEERLVLESEREERKKKIFGP